MNPKKFVIWTSILAFMVNLFWEIVQLPVFFITDQGLWEHLPKCLQASAGDVVTTFVFYGIIAGLRRDIGWIRTIRAVDVLLLLLCGFIGATGIEKWALDTGRWRYSPVMPRIPLLNVGLVPVIQMMTLPILTFALAKRLSGEKALGK